MRNVKLSPLTLHKALKHDLCKQDSYTEKSLATIPQLHLRMIQAGIILNILTKKTQSFPSRNLETIVFIGCESSKLPQHLLLLCSRSQHSSQLQILPGNFNLISRLSAVSYSDFLGSQKQRLLPPGRRQMSSNTTGADGLMDQQKKCAHFYFSMAFQSLLS